MDDAERTRFIEQQTRLESPMLVPEIRLHAASELTPLWTATQSTLDLSDLEPPFWAFAWPGGQALARYVLDHSELVVGARVFDFAAGSGIVAIAAAKSGAACVTACDIDPLASVAARLNANASGVDIDVVSRDPVGEPLASVDVVLAGDVFYDRAAAARFDPWFRALAAAGRVVIVGDPGRAYLPPDLARVADYHVPVAFEVESTKSMRTTIWRYP